MPAKWQFQPKATMPECAKSLIVFIGRLAQNAHFTREKLQSKVSDKGTQSYFFRVIFWLKHLLGMIIVNVMTTVKAPSFR